MKSIDWNQRMELANTYSSMLSGSSSLESLLTNSLHTFRILSDRDICCILINANKDWELWVASDIGFNDEINKVIRNDLEPHFRELFGSKLPVKLKIQTMERQGPSIGLMYFSSTLILPIITKSGIQGLIYIASIEKKDFHSSEQNFFGVLSTLLSVCFERIQLRD